MSTIAQDRILGLGSAEWHHHSPAGHRHLGAVA